MSRHRKNTTKAKSKALPRKGLGLIDASHLRKMVSEPDLKREIRSLRHSNDIANLVALYDAYTAAADAILGIENQPRARGVDDVLQAEWNWLLLKAWTVAEHLKSLRPDDDNRELFVSTLFNCALEMGHELDGANSVLLAAMERGTSPT